MQPILIGQADFASLRNDGGLYVDKSGFIAEVLERPPVVQLYPRPRRFGKTLNLSMLKYFFERGVDRSGLFSDLSIWQNENARRHFGRYPVITLTFKDVKESNWADALSCIRGLLAEEIERHVWLLTDESLDPDLRKRLALIKAGEGNSQRMLRDLSVALAKATGERVVFLIDEYDAPLLTAWQYDYYDEVTSWFRSFLTAGLKDNQYLYKGVLTGILRVAKESMFSGLNNISVYSLLQSDLPEPFGFTDGEVQELLRMYGREGQSEEVRTWYNGYRFGSTIVYNPWSILNCLSRPGLPLQPWWVNTSDNALVKELLLGHTELSAEIETLLQGRTIEKRIEENVALRELRDNAIWDLLLFSGYLRTEKVWVVKGRTYGTLSIPNFEVSIVWESVFLDWLTSGLGRLEPLHQALLHGDARTLELLLSKLLVWHVSHHDLKGAQAEAFYHAFVLGLLVTLEETHRVHSNRESGYGRSDVQIVPKQPGKAGVVLEFKNGEEGRKLETLAGEALLQIEEQRYATELEAAGAAPIWKFGIAFEGKKVVVRRG